MEETISSPLVSHLASKVERLTSENANLRKRLEDKTVSWKEQTMSLQYSMEQCDMLRCELRKIKAKNIS